MAAFIFLQGCVMARSKLIEEILSSKPELFEPLDVTPIVLRYFLLGKDRQAVISELTSQGFEFKEAKEKIKGCAECDPLVISGRHIKSRLILPGFVKTSRIWLGFGFKQGKLVHVDGTYILEAF